jgi:hypothetical protein
VFDGATLLDRLVVALAPIGAALVALPIAARLLRIAEFDDAVRLVRRRLTGGRASR